MRCASETSDTSPYSDPEQEGEEIGKMIAGTIGFLKRSKSGADEPGVQAAIREEFTIYADEP